MAVSISPWTIVVSAVIPTPAAAITTAIATSATTTITATSTTTIAAASAATIATATIAATSTAAAATALLFIGFFYRKLFSFQTSAVEGLDSPPGIGIIWHVYKAKTPAFSGFAVEDHFSRTDFAVQFHHLLEIDIIQI